MLTHTDLKKGVRIILDGEPYEILESSPMKKAQGRVVTQTKVKNLISGNVFERNFHQGDTFETAEILKFEAKFLYSHPDRPRPHYGGGANGVSRERYFFCEKDNPQKRFDLDKETIGDTAKFLKPNQIVEEIQFEEKIINISLPIKIQLRVAEAPPGIKGDRAQGGTKTITLETGAVINAPLFIKTGDIIEINTETGEYVRRIE